MAETEVLNRDAYETQQGKIFLTDDGSLRELAAQVIRCNQGRLKNVVLDEIDFVVVEGEKGDWLAKCTKIPPMYRVLLPGDKKFIITFSATMIEHVAPGSHDKLMLHELYHANCAYDCINDHDTEDFEFMLKDYGVDWKHNDKHIILPENLRKLIPWGQPGAVKTASGKDLPSAVQGPATASSPKAPPAAPSLEPLKTPTISPAPLRSVAK